MRKQFVAAGALALAACSGSSTGGTSGTNPLPPHETSTSTSSGIGSSTPTTGSGTTGGTTTGSSGSTTTGTRGSTGSGGNALEGPLAFPVAQTENLFNHFADGGTNFDNHVVVLMRGQTKSSCASPADDSKLVRITLRPAPTIAPRVVPGAYGLGGVTSPLDPGLNGAASLYELLSASDGGRLIYGDVDGTVTVEEADLPHIRGRFTAHVRLDGGELQPLSGSFDGTTCDAPL